MSRFDDARELISKVAVPDDEAVCSIAKTSDEKRYTLGVMYVPGARDSDNEYAEADELQRACWDFVKSGNKRIRDTHTKTEIGDLVELVSWPLPVEVDLKHADGTVTKRKLPANTIFAGVVYDEKVWPLVKSGKLRGYSMGGKAVRLKNAVTDEELPKMASYGNDDPVTKAKGEIPNKPGVSNWVEDAGGLPAYIEKIAKSLVKTHGVSGAIGMAVGICKRWARGGDNVTEKTRVQAAAAIAQWEKMKAQSHVGKSADVEFSDEKIDVAEFILRVEDPELL